MNAVRSLTCLAIGAVAALSVPHVFAEDEAPSDASAETATDPTLEDFAWLAGTWRSGTDGPMTFEEHWTAPWLGTMSAVSRGGQGDKTSLFELSTIEATDDGFALHLRHFNPGLVPWESEADGPLIWPLVEHGESMVKFHEPTRDFPRTVTYARTGAKLNVTLEGEQDGSPAAMQFELTLTTPE